MIPVLEVFGFVAIPVCQTVFTAMLGALIAHPRLCGLSNEDKMALCKMYAYVFFPCFLVDKLVHGLSAGRFVEWWPLLASLAANTFMGVGLGYVTAVFLQRVGYLSRSDRGVLIAAISFGNMSQIPHSLVEVACRQDLEKYATRSGVCKVDAHAMIAFGTSVGTVLVWTLGAWLSRPAVPPREDNFPEAQRWVAAENSKSAPSPFADLATPSLRDSGESERTEISKAATIPMDLPAVWTPPNLLRRGCCCAARVVSDLLATAVTCPPVLACIVGITLGTVPELQTLLVGDGAPLAPVAQLLRQLGGCTLPVINMVLGASLLLSRRAAAAGDACATTSCIAVSAPMEVIANDAVLQIEELQALTPTVSAVAVLDNADAPELAWGRGDTVCDPWEIPQTPLDALAFGAAPECGVFSQQGQAEDPEPPGVELAVVCEEARAPVAAAACNLPARGESKVHPAVVVSVVIVRMVVLPAFSAGLVVMMRFAGVLPADPLVEFVMLLQAATPTAMQLAAVCALYSAGEKLLPSLIVVQYVVAVPIVTLWVTAFLAVEI